MHILEALLAACFKPAEPERTDMFTEFLSTASLLAIPAINHLRLHGLCRWQDVAVGWAGQAGPSTAILAFAAYHGGPAAIRLANPVLTGTAA
jgi:hypothetical protein